MNGTRQVSPLSNPILSYFFSNYGDFDINAKILVTGSAWLTHPEYPFFGKCSNIRKVPPPRPTNLKSKFSRLFGGAYHKKEHGAVTDGPAGFNADPSDRSRALRFCLKPAVVLVGTPMSVVVGDHEEVAFQRNQYGVPRDKYVRWTV